MNIAIVGSGIAGLTAAWLLHQQGHALTIYEAGKHVGGHTHTHDIIWGGKHYAVDTGFIVFNDWTYPHFIRLLDELGVESQPSSMSFSVQCEKTGLEYNGTTINTLFAQRRNLLRPFFYRMISEILRFNRVASGWFSSSDDDALTLGEFLDEHRFGPNFREHYILPMGAAIWSTSTLQMLAFPARFFMRFFHNHGMLSVDDRPQWRVVRGGSARYVSKLISGFRDGIRLKTPVEWIKRPAGHVIVKAAKQEAQSYDAVFLACHSDQALRLLADPTPTEREVLSALPYQRNSAVLHTDRRLLPRSRLAHAAWNYFIPRRAEGLPSVTYHMNILQSLNSADPFLLTLNRDEAIDPTKVLARMEYDHPLFTTSGIAAQARQAEINGPRRTYFCGAYWRNGFHEDGVVSALKALEHFHQRLRDHGQLPLSRLG